MQSPIIKARGLNTFPNQLSLSDGYLTVADNVNVSRDNVIEPRRGFGAYGTDMPNGADRATSLLTYKGRILRHIENSGILQFDSNGTGTFSSFAGTYTPTETGLRIKGLEANSNFYFTTDDGVKKISASSASDLTTASGYIRDSGAPQALDGNAAINYDSAGFFLPESKVAYKIVWGYRDANNNLILGAPSQRIVVTNFSATDSGTVDLEFAIPDDIGTSDTDYFYQIYRTAVFEQGALPSLDDVDPGEECNLVIEDFPTSAQLTASLVTLTDITPEDFRTAGTPLYNNPVSGEGLLQTNDQPPVAKDIALFKESMFYANTRTKHQLEIALLSVSGLTSGVSTITITDGPTDNTYTFVGEEEITQLTFDTFANTEDGGYFLLNSASDERLYAFYADKTGTTPAPVSNELVGRLIYAVNLVGDVTANDVAVSFAAAIDALDDFSAPAPGAAIVTVTNAKNGNTTDATNGFSVTEASSAGLVTEGTDTINITAHGLINGQKITYSSDTTDITGLTTGNNYFVVGATDDTFQLSATSGGAAIDLTDDGAGNHTFSSGIGGVFAIAVIQQGDGEDQGSNHVLLSSAATPSQQLDETARSLIQIINGNSTEIVNAFYLSGQNDVPGQILLKAKDLSTDEFYVIADSDTTGSQFNPTLPDNKSGTAGTGIGTVTITSALHGLSNGDQIVIYASMTTPNIDGEYTISNVAAGTFDISTTVSVGGSVTFGLTEVNSDNEVQPNVLFFSKYQEPEAVPIVNQIPIGPKDKQIVRILPLRESLFILKEDGVYRLTGEQGNFIVDLFDSSVTIGAPDSAVALNNQIYVLTDQDVTTISDTGASIISRPIENTIVKVTSSQFDFRLTSFGVAYENDRSYLLWVPTISSDTVATQCFRYDSFTNNWTRYPISKVSGIVNPSDTKLYLGPADENFIEQERKNFDRTDYADREISLTLPADSVGDLEIELSSNADAEIGDALVQTQYLTISQFNRLLKKLDLDTSVADSDYFSTLGVVAGDELRNPVNNLATKLDADTGVTDTNYAALLVGTDTFPVIQSDFNIIVNKLNLDTGVDFVNYTTSDGTLTLEVIITEVIKNSNLVDVAFNIPFIEGPISLFKGIQAEVVWAPHTFGDPSVMKQVNEATIMFEDTIFSSAEVAYASDLSPSFEEIDFNESGPGDWGLFIWGQQNWGGQGSSVPFRTYIPRDKQRCRFIRKRFIHNGSRNKFSIFGISFTFRPISERAYRVRRK